MRKRPGLWCAVLAMATLTSAQTPSKKEYLQRCAIIKQNIQQHFFIDSKGYYKEVTFRDSNDKKTYSYLWPLCGLIQAANEWEGATKKIGYMKTVLGQLQPYHDEAMPAPGYNSYIMAEGKEERFYDDNQWIGLACMDAYHRTKDKQYLQTGEEIYRFMMTGFDTVSGGGLYWKEGDKTTKNTCSNGPGVLLALQLYKATGQKTYLDTALLLYNWTNKNLLAPEGVYYDHIKLPSRKIDKQFYTYNAGTMLQANTILYELTKDKQYLNEANHLAGSALRVFFKNGRWPSHKWFNAVLLRGYIALLNYNPDRKYINAFIQDGEEIWKKERDNQSLLGKSAKKNLLDQAAMLEIYAELAQL